MDAKLTLKIDQKVIDRAKKYAASKKMSLSKIVEAYLHLLTSENESDDFEISPYVKSMTAGKQLPNDLKYKDEYYNHRI